MSCSRPLRPGVVSMMLGTSHAGQAMFNAFDDLVGGGFVSGGCGNRVAGSDGGPGCIQGNGWTPNMAVSFDALNLATSASTCGGLRTRGRGFGDLSTPVWPVAEAGFTGWFSFTSAPGCLVGISSFQPGGYPTRDWDGQPVHITDADFNVLWAGESHVEGWEGVSPSLADYAPNPAAAGLPFTLCTVSRACP